MRKRKEKSKQGRWTYSRAKEEHWRKQVELWQRSGLSVCAFCKEHGIVETSFYAWRRELIIRAREIGMAEELTSAAQMTPNTLKDGRGRTIAISLSRDGVTGQTQSSDRVGACRRWQISVYQRPPGNRREETSDIGIADVKLQ